MKKLLLTLVLPCFVLVAMAQVNPKAGFVITLQNDTLWGTLDLRSDEMNSKHCTFLQDGQTEWKTYLPYEINGYRFSSNGKYYVSRTFTIDGTPTKCFAEYMLKGMMNVYFVPKGNHYFLENEDGNVAEYHYDSSSNVNAREAIKPLFKVIGKSVSASEDVKLNGMNKADIIKLGHDYHNDVCTSNEDCIEFEYDEKTNVNKLKFRIFAGGNSIMKNKVYQRNGLAKYEATISKFAPVVGVGIDELLPRVAPGMMVQAQATIAFASYTTDMERTGTTDVGLKNVNTSDTHFAVQVGPGYIFNAKGKGIKPEVMAGATIDANFHSYKGSKPTKPVDTDAGLYVGGGLLFPVGKIDIVFDVTYRCYFTNFPYSNILATLGVRI